MGITIKMSLYTKIEIGGNKHMRIVYDLVYNGNKYGISSFIVGSNNLETDNRCFVDDISDNEIEVERIILNLASHTVMPIHVKEIIEDTYLSDICQV